MKKLLLVLSVISIPVILIFAGCTHTPPPAGEETSSCVICHSDEEALRQTATVEEEATSGETTGEG